jgi:hypothetical protein
MNELINNYKRNILIHLKNIETEHFSFDRDIKDQINKDEQTYIDLITDKNDEIYNLTLNITKLQEKYDKLTNDYNKLNEDSQEFEKVSIFKNINKQLHEKNLECEFLNKQLKKYKENNLKLTIEETIEESNAETKNEIKYENVDENDDYSEEEIEFIEKRLKCPKTKKFKLFLITDDDNQDIYTINNDEPDIHIGKIIKKKPKFF